MVHTEVQINKLFSYASEVFLQRLYYRVAYFVRMFKNINF